MKYSRNLGHPGLSLATEELALRWQSPGIVQRPCHDVSKMFHCSLSHLENTATAGWAKFPVQHDAASIVGLMDGGLLALGGIGERGGRNFGRQAKRAAKESLYQGSAAVIAVMTNAQLVEWTDVRDGLALQLLQWQREVRASSGDTSMVYLSSPQ